MDARMKSLCEQAGREVVQHLFGRGAPGSTLTEGAKKKKSEKKTLTETQDERLQRIFEKGILTEEEQEDMRDLFQVEGSFEDRRRRITEALEEKYEAVRMLATYPDGRAVFESSGKVFEVTYTLDGEACLLNESVELEPRFFPKETARAIGEQQEKRSAGMIFEQRVAGIYREPSPSKTEPGPLNEATLSKSERFDLKVAGLL